MKPVLYSALNPLATCFIPSSMKKIGENKTKKPHLNIKDYDENINLKTKNKVSSAITKFKASDPETTNRVEKLDIIMSLPAIDHIIDLKHSAYKLVNEQIYFTEYDLNSTLVKVRSEISLSLDPFFNSLTVFPFSTEQKSAMIYEANDIEKTNDLQKNSKYYANDHEETNAVEENSNSDERCSCPPMFGCIVPPDFFGNPFNFNFSCKKKHVHMCDYSDENTNVSTFLKPDIRCIKKPLKDLNQKAKLEQYSWKFKEVVNDVYEMISIADCNTEDSLCNGDNRNSATGLCRADADNQTEAAFNESLKENSCFNTGMSVESDIVNDMKIPKDAQIIDEDFHPLLDEGIFMGSDDEGVSPEIKEMIEFSFSPKDEPRLSFDPEELPGKTVCIPPCSVWCDSVPHAAKDTYRKFIKSLPELQGSSNSSKRRNSSILYPTFKPKRSCRSFSESHSLKQNKENIDAFQSNLDFESKAKTLLLENPINCNILSQPRLSVKYDKCKSLPLSENLSLTSLNEMGPYFHKTMNRTSMWGPFDGADSLWQSLPDCVQTFEHNPKKHLQKRVHELRRQMTWN